MKTKKSIPRLRNKASAMAAPSSLEGLLGMVDLAESGVTRELASPASVNSKSDLGPGPVVAKIVEIDNLGRPKVNVQVRGKSKATVSRSTIRVTVADLGREALVFFEGGNVSRPIITGFLEPVEDLKDSEIAMPKKRSLQAEQELILKCGSASITLTKDGRIVIRGSDVLTRSSGSNRIKGGSVHIN